jgi:hypothetical protein
VLAHQVEITHQFTFSPKVDMSPKFAKTGLYASESRRYARTTGIAPSRRRGPHDQHAAFSGKNCEKLLSGSYYRRFDAYIHPKTAVNLTLTREFEPYFDSPFPGEVMSQNRFWAKLCVRKIIVGSSIQAQCTGEFMSQKRRTYGIFNTIL